MSSPEKLEGALMRTLKGMNMELRAKEARAMAAWAEIVGPVTAVKTQPLYVNRGTMVVGVASSAWANQLNLLKTRLLIALEEKVGPGVIRELRWKTGPWEEPEPGKRHHTPREPHTQATRAPEGPPLAKHEMAAIQELTAPISDPRLAKQVERALLAQARRRERLRGVGWVPCRRCGVLYDRADRAITRQDAVTIDVIMPPAGVSAPAPQGDTGLCPACKLAEAAGPHQG